MDTMIVLKDKFTAGLSDEEFFRFCQENHALRIERNSKMEIVIMSPVSTHFSFYSGAVFTQLFNWTVKERNGIAFDSSAGFTLPDKSVLSPDASWISGEKWKLLSEAERNSFAHVCPEFIIEVRSKSDDLADLRKKMASWLDNGAQVAWLVDPIEKQVTIYEDHLVKTLDGFNRKITGSGPVSGFELDLSLLEYDPNN
jgi:Uma2 family endonuclease